MNGFDWDDLWRLDDAFDFFIGEGEWNLKKILMVIMALLYIAAGVNHFINPDFYLRIMPPFIPAHELMVQLSGIAEILLGLGLLIPVTRKLAAWGIIAILLIFMLVHGDMAIRPHLYPPAPYWLVLARIPLQFLLIAWAWWYTHDEDDQWQS